MALRLERTFTVSVPRERAWEHLARVEDWPSWARHINSIDVDPKGELTNDTRGVIRLKGGIRSTFRMTRLDPPQHWRWVGKFLWLDVDYDHLFVEQDPDITQIRFIVEVRGFGATTLGRVFRAIYARNLDRAIPNLIRELETAS